jgi:hypothetical protein
MAGGAARYFFGNSFAITGGAGFRTLSVYFDTSTQLPGGAPSVLTTDVSSFSLITTVAVGNYWTIANRVLIGASWVGYSIPLTNSVTDRSSTSGPLFESDQPTDFGTSKFAKDIGSDGAIFMIAHFGVWL